MHQKLFVYIIFYFPLNLFGQNLILNGGFEDFSSCPSKNGNFYVYDWSVPGSLSTPDLFSSCAPEDEFASIENAWIQTQPYQGNSYGGIVVFVKGSQYREYITAHLNSRLLKDSIYKISLAVSQPPLSRWSIDFLEGVFSSDKITFFGNREWLTKADVSFHNKQFLKTEAGQWITLSTEYKASGEEKFITIGNFRLNDTSKTQLIEGRKSTEYKKTYNQAYYLIDDFSIEPLFEPNENSYTTCRDTLTLIFEHNVYSLNEGNKISIHNFMQTYLNNKDVYISILGFADSTGSYEYNYELSMKRAKEVETLLLKEFPEVLHLSYTAKGVTTNFGNELGKNRRVDIILTCK